MSVHSHDPGPWKACGTIYEHMNAEVRSGAKGEGQPIAQVWEGPNGFRNALLLAAAPEMLDALKLAREDIAAWVDGYGDHGSMAVLDRIDAAIANATGSAA